MNVQSKKVVAREFLLFVICLGICLITFLTLTCLNFFQNDKINNYENSIEKYLLKQDSLNREFKIKSDNQQKFTDYINKSSSDKYYKYPNKVLWDRLKYLADVDSITDKWNSYDSSQKSPLLNYQITTAQEFKSFIDQNVPVLSVSSYNDSMLYDLRIKSAQHSKKVINNSKIIAYSFRSFLVSFFLLFILRYLFISIKWSLGILKK